MVKFVERIKTVHAAALGNGQTAQSHAVETPYASREALLTRLRDDLYDDFMAFDHKNVASGSVVTAQIEASYQPIDLKANKFEYNALDFLEGVLAVIGIEDEEPTFTRSRVINQNEQISAVTTAAQYLDGEYVTRKVLTILGDGDQADDVIKRMDAEDMDRINVPANEPSGNEPEAGGNEAGGEG